MAESLKQFIKENPRNESFDNIIEEDEHDHINTEMRAKEQEELKENIRDFSNEYETIKVPKKPKLKDNDIKKNRKRARQEKEQEKM